MQNLAYLSSMALTVILVPWVIHSIPYFKRPDVVARRAAKAQLPGWVSLAELVFWLVSEVLLVAPLFLLEAYIHSALHPGTMFLASMQSSYSLPFICWIIEAFAPIIVALPLGMGRGCA